jgi:hypothetical protein
MDTNICKICGKQTNHHNAKTCSDHCKQEYLVNKINKEKAHKLGQEKYNNLAVCQICGMRGDDLTSHITKKHKLTVKCYREKYGVHRIHSKEYLKKSSERFKGEKNPVHKIKDKRILSPYSYMFYVRKGYDEETAKKMALEKAQKTQNSMSNEQRTVSIEYWLKKTNGDRVKAERLLSERQCTFSKEICIEKYGEQKGMRVWQERQEKWLSMLDSKTDEEKAEINNKKSLSSNFEYMSDKYGHEKAVEIFKSRFVTNGYSKISQELFISVYEKIKDEYECRFAILKDNGEIKDDGKNNEYVVHTNNNRIRFLDFYIPELKCCIEFEGDYYHSDKFRKGNKERDRIREEEILDTVPDMKILHIYEHEYV